MFVEIFYEGDIPEMYMSNYQWSFLNVGADICKSNIYVVYLYDGEVYQHRFIRYFI